MVTKEEPPNKLKHLRDDPLAVFLRCFLRKRVLLNEEMTHSTAHQ